MKIDPTIFGNVDAKPAFDPVALMFFGFPVNRTFPDIYSGGLVGCFTVSVFRDCGFVAVFTAQGKCRINSLPKATPGEAVIELMQHVNDAAELFNALGKGGVSWNQVRTSL